jgi:hypothetical protein
MAPRGYAVKNLVFHILQRQRGGLADNFAEAFDAQHIALLVEAFREAVGVDDEAIAGLDGHDDGGFATHGVFQQAENGAAGFEKARSLSRLDDHSGRMSCVGEFERACVAIQTCGDHREIEDGRADIAEHEAIQVVHHRAKRGAPLDLRHGFGVDAIGDERRADAVAGNIAHKKAERIVPRRDEPEIAADCANGLIVGGDIDAAPGESGRCEALLNAGGEQEIFFDFAVALFEFFIRFAQRIFGALLLGDVRGGNHGENVAVGIFNLLRRDQHRKTIAVRLWQIELVLVVTLGLPALDLLAQHRCVLGRIQVQNLAADQFVLWYADHLQEKGIGEHDVATVVVDDDALIDGFQDASHFANPGERCFWHGVLAFVSAVVEFGAL